MNPTPAVRPFVHSNPVAQYLRSVVRSGVDAGYGALPGATRRSQARGVGVMLWMLLLFLLSSSVWKSSKPESTVWKRKKSQSYLESSNARC